MKAVKQVRVWHESEGKVTQEFKVFVNRGQPGTGDHLVVTSEGIRAGTALGEIAVSKTEFIFTAKHFYKVEVQRFYLAAEPVIYNNLFSAAQGALEFTELFTATINMGMLSITINKLRKTITIRVWEHARVEMF